MLICNIAPSLFLFFDFFLSSSLTVLSFILFFLLTSIFLPSISLSYFPFISLHHFILYATIPQKFQRFSNSFFITMVEFSLLFWYQSETIYRPRKTKSRKGWNSMKHTLAFKPVHFLGLVCRFDDQYAIFLQNDSGLLKNNQNIFRISNLT